MIFSQDDLILPNEKCGLSEDEISLLINVKCPVHLKNKCQQIGQNKCKANDYLSPAAHTCESLDTIDSSASSNSDEKCAENKFSSTDKGEETHLSYSEIMMKRW